MQGKAFMDVESRRFSLISITKPSTSFALMLNSGPRSGGCSGILFAAELLEVIIRISADGIADDIVVVVATATETVTFDIFERSLLGIVG